MRLIHSIIGVICLLFFGCTTPVNLHTASANLNTASITLLNPDDPAFRKKAPDHFSVLLTTSRGDILLARHLGTIWHPR